MTALGGDGKVRHKMDREGFDVAGFRARCKGHRRGCRLAGGVQAATVWAALCLLAAACTSGGVTDGDAANPDEEAEAQEPLSSETASDEAEDVPDDDVPEFTLDGSEVQSDITDVWTTVNDTDLLPDDDRSRFGTWKPLSTARF